MLNDAELVGKRKRRHFHCPHGNCLGGEYYLRRFRRSFRGELLFPSLPEVATAMLDHVHDVPLCEIHRQVHIAAFNSGDGKGLPGEILSTSAGTFSTPLRLAESATELLFYFIILFAMQSM